MSRTTPAIVLIGATGYTGRLIADELARGSDPFVLAARDSDRLKQMAAGIEGGTPQVVDVTDRDSLLRLIRPGDAVINTAGPFTELGEPVVAACVELGAHYLDTTGEQPFMRAMHHRYDNAARNAGVAIVNAMAFEYALGDCALAVAAEEFDGELSAIDVVYAWGGTASSRGTRRTVLRMLGRKGWVREDGAPAKSLPGGEHRTVRLASGKVLHAVGFGAGEVVTAPRYLSVPTVRGWLVMGARTARIVPLLAPALPLLVPLVRPLIEPWVLRTPDPTPEQREASAFTIRVELEGLAGERAAVEVQGRDPYGLTAVIAVEGARRAMAGAGAAGVLAPSQLVEPAGFLADLSRYDLALVRDPSPE